MSGLKNNEYVLIFIIHAIKLGNVSHLIHLKQNYLLMLHLLNLGYLLIQEFQEQIINE